VIIDVSNKDLAEMQDIEKFCELLKHLLRKKPVEIEFEKT
jgi:hypothetical protein